ncbi:MAG: transcriptional repressor NrdR [Alphaproteobacteria bacterium]|nr:transcriptional repressor NrdR [Alphaproteobacteria bacterium]
MRCPFCGHEDTQVKDSRPSVDNAAVRRRRECVSCDTRFTTFERAQLSDLTVIKNNSRREPFERDKLIRSLKIALQKRPVTAETLERGVNDIIHNLESSGDAEISSKIIGECVMQILSRLDSVAYVRYASVYKNFHEVDDFNAFLGKLKKI